MAERPDKVISFAASKNVLHRQRKSESVKLNDHPWRAESIAWWNAGRDGLGWFVDGKESNSASLSDFIQ